MVVLIQERGNPELQIHISASDGVSIYLHVVNQIKYWIAGGSLVGGEELPPIRTLAEKLVVNPNTIARAYRELEIAGIVKNRRTAGTYVSDQGSPLARRVQIKILTDHINQLLAEAGQTSVSLEEIVKLTQQPCIGISLACFKRSQDPFASLG